MATDLINVGKNAMNVTKSDIHIPYTKVIVVCGEEETDEGTVIKQYEAGDDTGLTLEVNCPWGTQAMANNIFASIGNNRYKPYTVTSALLNPAAEIGDGVNTNAVFGGLYKQESTFGHGFYSDYSAPTDEQMNHEYKYESQTERRITRENNETKAYFRATTSEINAEVARKVAKEGGEIASNKFGWKLLDTSFTLYSNNKNVFVCDATGLTVNGNGTFTGTITAKDGRIGASWDSTHKVWTGGFILTAGKFYTDGHPAYNTDANGVYVGTDGIGCGAGKFYVTNTGELHATSGTFSGSITGATGTFSGSLYVSNLIFTDPNGNTVTINGSNLTSGTVGGTQLSDSSVSSGKISGGAVTGGKIANGAVTKTKTDSNVQTSLGNGDAAYAAVTSLTAGTVQSYNIKTSYMTVTNTLDSATTQTTTLKVKLNSTYTTASWKEATIDGTTIKYLGRT